jgi:hypothetical protein
VCFTRDPSTGDKKFFGEYLINAQGEDVVAGTRTPQQVTLEGSRRWAQLALVSEEERRSKTEVYHGEDSIGKRALQRVLLKKQLDAMGAELREIMVYQSPPELGALWTEVEAMMKVVGREQAGAIAVEMQRNAIQRKIKAKKLKILKYRVTCWSITTVAVAYLACLVWAVVQIRIEQRPDLGRCWVPKGQWPYEYYNNLKWIDCEVK